VAVGIRRNLWRNVVMKSKQAPDHALTDVIGKKSMAAVVPSDGSDVPPIRCFAVVVLPTTVSN
jgi:hypothetical protein